MDVIQRGIITLIKSAVLQQSLALPEGFELERAYDQIKRHSLIAICYDGAVRCGIEKTLPVMEKLYMGSVRSLQISELQLRSIRALTQAFEEAGIDYMPLKGTNMKQLYPAPELRSMGDADILIRMEQYDKVVPIVQGKGYEFVVESDHEYVWRHRFLYLELHKRIIPSYNRDYYAYFGDGWRLAHRETGRCFRMKPEDELIYEFTHLAKHFRDGGIGLRHVTDLWVFRRAHPHLNETYIRAEVEKLGLTRFWDHIHDLMDCWFADQPEEDMTAFLTAYIFASGSWGLAEEHFLSGLLRKERDDPIQTNRAGYVLSNLFPGAERLAPKYTVLKKAPWLLPAVWVYRPFYKLFRERDSLKREVAKVDLVTEEKIDGKRQMLRSVGLDFNY